MKKILLTLIIFCFALMSFGQVTRTNTDLQINKANPTIILNGANPIIRTGTDSMATKSEVRASIANLDTADIDEVAVMLDNYTYQVAHWKVLGSDVKAIPLGATMLDAALITPASKTEYFATYYFPDTTIITGMRVTVERAGVYDSASTNYNGVSLYSSNNTGITFIDSTRNGDGGIWKATAGTTIDSTFAQGPHTLPPGEYKVGVLVAINDLAGWHTLPRLIGKTSVISTFARFKFTNNRKLTGYKTTTTTPPATLEHSSIAGGIDAIQVVLY